MSLYSQFDFLKLGLYFIYLLLTCLCRCKDDKIDSSTPGQGRAYAKRAQAPNKEASNKEIPKTKRAKNTKDEKDDKRRTDTETKFTKDKKTVEENVNAYGSQKRYAFSDV